MTNSPSYILAEKVIKQARNKGLTIATAESCTGGWIGKALTDIPGSSRVFKGGLVAYSNAIKETLLHVPKELLIKHGAVSEPVAIAMANNCAQSFGADLAISVTGIAGPGGGSDEKPVGLVYMAVSHNNKTTAHRFVFDDTGRDGVRRDALSKALNLLLGRIIQTET